MWSKNQLNSIKKLLLHEDFKHKVSIVHVMLSLYSLVFYHHYPLVNSALFEAYFIEAKYLLCRYLM